LTSSLKHILNAQVIRPINIKLIWHWEKKILAMIRRFQGDVLTSKFQTAKTTNFKHDQAVKKTISFAMNAILEQLYFPQRLALL
jgi:hypothetical protein